MIDIDEYTIHAVSNIINIPEWQRCVYQLRDMTVTSSLEMAYKYSPVLFMYFLHQGVTDAVMDVFVSGVSQRGTKWSGKRMTSMEMILSAQKKAAVDMAEAIANHVPYRTSLRANVVDVVSTDVLPDCPMTMDYRLGLLFNIPGAIQESYTTRNIPRRQLEHDMSIAMRNNSVEVAKVIMSCKASSLTPIVSKLIDDIIIGDSPELYDEFRTIFGIDEREWSPSVVLRRALGMLRLRMINHLIPMIHSSDFIMAEKYDTRTGPNDMLMPAIEKYGSEYYVERLIELALASSRYSLATRIFAVKRHGSEWMQRYVESGSSEDYVLDAIWAVYPGLLIDSGRPVVVGNGTSLTPDSREYADVSFVWF